MKSKAAEVRLDFARRERKGFSEVIFCPGKSDEQLRVIAEDINTKRLDTAFSRMSVEQYELIASVISPFRYDPVSRLGMTGYNRIEPNGSAIVVLSAGSTDVPVAEEAAGIAEFSGCAVKRFYDVGVAGIHRLLEVLPEVCEADAVIVAAGMDGALPSVVAGLVPSLVIGLPTSVGYGIAENGKTALRSMLCSCSPGLVVVNIDNGIGAGLAAVMAVCRK
ncbi:MAG: nickel pincer cofactor biosynthesis protein LarB [Synergistaceae bacterium]|nr:nickel pincer cofactor biosynthesis protein LarB [Synergistaceae bacterium]